VSGDNLEFIDNLNILKYAAGVKPEQAYDFDKKNIITLHSGIKAVR
jgi:hypothetical protein